jgi:hypothetical protein
VLDFTGAPRGQAAAALHATGGNVQTAIEMLLEGVVFPELATAAAAAAPAAAPAVWEFDDHPNGFRPLAPATQSLLETAFASGQAQASFTFRQFTYDVDLQVGAHLRAARTRVVRNRALV